MSPLEITFASDISIGIKSTFFSRQPKQWCSNTFKNVNVVPPDVGAVHQVNLEHLSRVVQVTDGFMYPDSVVGTDSHTTMVNGLGILGWGELVFLLWIHPNPAAFRLGCSFRTPFPVLGQVLGASSQKLWCWASRFLWPCLRWWAVN